MKFVLFIAGVVLLQVTGSQCHHPPPPEFLECAKEAGISEDMLKDGPVAHKGQPEFKCLTACMMKKKGELEAGNTINLDKLKANRPPKYADKFAEMDNADQECADTAKGNTDECDFANAFKECLHTKFPIGPKGGQ
ncbi:general odorant-binding protein 19d-like [Belonocnema kinseyi]|uniref:general odorant-binding protein 19d-like n=1 Tax=Belonocnema kinseyi TaxID=2817044 RepID=UPI00143DA35D|nr:general odorant-binding protein 19d-like [Belonocnema kinseyi]